MQEASDPVSVRHLTGIVRIVEGSRGLAAGGLTWIGGARSEIPITPRLAQTLATHAVSISQTITISAQECEKMNGMAPCASGIAK